MFSAQLCPESGKIYSFAVPSGSLFQVLVQAPVESIYNFRKGVSQVCDLFCLSFWTKYLRTSIQRYFTLSVSVLSPQKLLAQDFLNQRMAEIHLPFYHLGTHVQVFAAGFHLYNLQNTELSSNFSTLLSNTFFFFLWSNLGICLRVQIPTELHEWSLHFENRLFTPTFCFSPFNH